MNAPVLWIVIPAFLSLILLLIKNYQIKTIGFTLVSLIFFILTFFIGIDAINNEGLISINISSTLNILGRSFVLQETDLFLIQLVFFINFLWGVSAYLFGNKILIVPFGLLFSAFLLAAISVEPFLYSALIIEIAVILSIPLLGDVRSGSKKGGIRYLIYLTMAMPFILLAGWFLAGGEINPVNPQQLIQATLLLGLGFIFWLAVFPFHSWVPMVFEESDPVNAGYILLMLQTFIFILVIKYINGFVWLRNYDVFFQALRFLGLIMAVFGSIGFFYQKNISKMIGFELLHSVGICLISIGLSSSAGIELFSVIIGSRILVFPLLFFTTSFMIQMESNLTISNIGEVIRDSPIAGAAFVFSLLSLAGMPLSVGFAPLQTMYQIYSDDQVFSLVLLIFSMSIKTIVVFKIIKDILRAKVEISKKEILIKENIFLISLTLIILLNGFYPKLILEQFKNLVNGFESLIK